MQVTGFSKRSISDQQGIVGYDFIASVSSNQGSMNFGLSGTNAFNFLLSSGRVYDPNGNFIYSYDANSSIEISGSVGQTSYDCYIQGNLIAMGVPWKTGIYSWLYANASNVSGNLNAIINGNLPDYSFSNSGNYFYSGATVTGNILNSNPLIRFRVYDIEVLQESAPFYISGFTSGDISSTGNFYVVGTDNVYGNYTLPLLFVTNFGNVEVDMTISGNNFVNPNVYLQISPTDSSVFNFIPKAYQAYFGTSLGITDLGVSLKYESGVTGNIYKFLQTGNFQSHSITGYITGVSPIKQFLFGISSGQDPLTFIMETGLGSGWFSSAPISATGFVSGNYQTQIFGTASGQSLISYFASGLAFCTATGFVGVTGGIFNCFASNVLGTGHSPIVDTGIISNATGQMFIYPTGFWHLPLALSSDQYASSILHIPKVYEGWLSTFYSVMGIGYASGAFVTGTVDSRFGLNFEPGYYTFSKPFNGIVSGFSSDFSTFNPAVCFQQEGLSTGILSGEFQLSGLLDCNSLSSLPSISFIGFPTGVFDSQGRLIQPNNIVFIQPSGGYPYEDSTLGVTLANISRRGNTSSGSGFFQNIITDCNTNGIWRETFGSTGNILVQTGSYYSSNQVFSKVSTEMYITGTGMPPLSGSPTSYADSGVAYFTISGNSTKRVALRGMSQSLGFGAASMIEMFLYKDNTLLETFTYQGDAYNELYNIVDNPSISLYGDVGGVRTLSTGNYKVVAISTPYDLSYIEFSQPAFSGCENGGGILFDVYRYGVPIGPASIDVVMYTDLTAREGTDYLLNTGTLTWGHMDSGHKQFVVPVFDNSNFGNNALFEITLTNVQGYNTTYGTRYNTTGIILDNDSAGIVTGVIQTTSGVVTGILQIPPNFCYPIAPSGSPTGGTGDGNPWGTPFNPSNPPAPIPCACNTGTGKAMYKVGTGITGISPLGIGTCYSNLWVHDISEADGRWHVQAVGICEAGCGVSVGSHDFCVPRLNCLDVILIPTSLYYSNVYTGDNGSYKDKKIVGVSGSNTIVGPCDTLTLLYRGCKSDCLGTGFFQIYVTGNKTSRASQLPSPKLP